MDREEGFRRTAAVTSGLAVLGVTGALVVAVAAAHASAAKAGTGSSGSEVTGDDVTGTDNGGTSSKNGSTTGRSGTFPRLTGPGSGSGRGSRHATTGGS